MQFDKIVQVILTPQVIYVFFSKDKVPYFDADIADANVSKYFEYKINLLAKNVADGNNSV